MQDVQYQIKKSMVYSEEANAEINVLTKMTLDMINLSLEAL